MEMPDAFAEDATSIRVRCISTCTQALRKKPRIKDITSVSRPSGTPSSTSTSSQMTAWRITCCMSLARSSRVARARPLLRLANDSWMIRLGLSGTPPSASRDMPRSRAARSICWKSRGSSMRRWELVSSTPVCRFMIRDSIRCPAMAQALRSITGSMANETRRFCPSAVCSGHDARLACDDAGGAGVGFGTDTASACSRSATDTGLTVTRSELSSVTRPTIRSAGFTSPRK